MDVRPGYKRTEVGVIPGSWSLRPLGELGKWLSGGTPSMSIDSYWSGEFPWVSAKDMKASRLHDSIDHITSKAVADGARLAPAGTVLIVIRGMILAHSFPVGRAERSLAFNQDIKAVIAGADVDSNFLLYWLMANAQKLRGLTTESTHGTKRLPTEMLFRELVACPPPLEQEAIADALTDADALIESLEQLLTKKRQIKKGTMQELLTGRKRLPGFDGEWHKKLFGDFAPLQRGFDLPNRHLRQGPYPVVYSNGVMNYHSSYQVRGPGVVTGRSGTIGNVTFVEGNFWPHNTALWVTSFKDCNPKFVYFLYAWIGLERFSSGSGVPTLNRNDVHDFKLLVPPTKDEQTTIATILSDMDEEIAALEAKLSKAHLIKQGMMQELLTGRIRLV